MKTEEVSRGFMYRTVSFQVIRNHLTKTTGLTVAGVTVPPKLVTRSARACE